MLTTKPDATPDNDALPEREYAKNATTAEQMQAIFGIYPLPDLIKKILHFEQTVGIEHSLMAYLTADDEPHEEYYGEEARRLIPFAYCEYSQDGYCLWNQDNNSDVENWPVVILGNEGGMSCVARNLEEFFVLTLTDRPLYGCITEWPPTGRRPKLGQVDEEREWPSPLNSQYRLYAASIGLQASPDPEAVLVRAQDEVNPALFAWEAPIGLAYEIEYFREHDQGHAYMLLIKETQVASDASLPSHLFPGTGSDTAWFEILGSRRPSSLEMAKALQAADPDYHLMDYNEVKGAGYFVAVDSDAPKPGVIAAPISNA